MNIVEDIDGDIRFVIYSGMLIEGEVYCVFDLFGDFLFECKNNSVDEEDSEWWEYEEDGGMISDSCSDEDSVDECLNKLESDFDENNNCIVFKIMICLIMN